MQPVFEGLTVVPFQFFPAFLHLQQEAGLQKIGEARGLFPCGRGIPASRRLRDAGVAEGLEEPIAEDLRLAFFVAVEMLADQATNSAMRAAGLSMKSGAPVRP